MFVGLERFLVKECLFLDICVVLDGEFSVV